MLLIISSEIIDDPILDLAHELSATLDFLIVHLLLLFFLRSTQLSLVDSVFLKNDRLHLRSPQLFLRCLLLSFLLFLPPYFLSLLQKSPLALFLRLHLSLLDHGFRFLFHRGRFYPRLNFWLNLFHFLLNFCLHLGRFLNFLPATYRRQDRRLLIQWHFWLFPHCLLFGTLFLDRSWRRRRGLYGELTLPQLILSCFLLQSRKGLFVLRLQSGHF